MIHIHHFYIDLGTHKVHTLREANLYPKFLWFTRGSVRGGITVYQNIFFVIARMEHTKQTYLKQILQRLWASLPHTIQLYVISIYY